LKRSRNRQARPKSTPCQNRCAKGKYLAQRTSPSDCAEVISRLAETPVAATATITSADRL
ncbi:hypothetical protein, partial [Mesorhizobium sp.]|uniref:hypothetical protein n=1 Tax=Mesorhizobium sp. TaxID=1871066 RepID=UPI0025FA6C89